MISLPLAQFIGGYSILQVLLFAIILGAAIAITIAILNAMGVAIPPVVKQVCLYLFLAFLGCIALVFLFNMVGSIR